MKKIIKDIAHRNFYIITSLLVLSLGILGTMMYKGPFLHVLLNNLWALSYSIVLNYLFLEHVWPFVINKKKSLLQNILGGILALFVYILLCSFGLYVWRSIGIQSCVYHPLKVEAAFYGELENIMRYSTMAFFVFVIAKHIYTHVNLWQSAQKLRIEKQEAELNFLKSQTNPHFLFNTLNNIYTLAIEKSEQTPESIMRLSKLLRYMLYETLGDNNTIEQEVAIINDYIALEQLRYDHTLTLTVNIDIDNLKQLLPPLLLIPLVENAFKHGTSETITDPFIDISIQLKQQQLYVHIRNSVEHVTEGSETAERIGIANLKRQLELLYTDYDLTLQQKNAVFTTTLHINLNSHV
ncbi:MAG: sensor histidine kinase [Chitinophagaceae bacterium]|nr:sensor histidine kinase [Chitinophagaceae bacterium]